MYSKFCDFIIFPLLTGILTFHVLNGVNEEESARSQMHARGETPGLSTTAYEEEALIQTQIHNFDFGEDDSRMECDPIVMRNSITIKNASYNHAQSHYQT